MLSVYVLIGLQGAGKSRWAEQHAERLEAEVVSSDAIRNELEAAGTLAESQSERVFGMVAARVERALRAGRNVIVDATHARRPWRRRVLEIARQHGARRVAVWFDVPLGVALERNAARPGNGWGSRVVPRPVVVNVARSFEPPTRAEFDLIWRITP